MWNASDQVTVSQIIITLLFLFQYHDLRNLKSSFLGAIGNQIVLSLQFIFFSKKHTGKIISQKAYLLGWMKNLLIPSNEL